MKSVIIFYGEIKWEQCCVNKVCSSFIHIVIWSGINKSIIPLVYYFYYRYIWKDKVYFNYVQTTWPTNIIVLPPKWFVFYLICYWNNYQRNFFVPLYVGENNFEVKTRTRTKNFCPIKGFWYLNCSYIRPERRTTHSNGLRGGHFFV